MLQHNSLTTTCFESSFSVYPAFDTNVVLLIMSNMWTLHEKH